MARTDVELVEDDLPPADPPADAGRDGGQGEGRGRRRALLLGAAVVAVLVVVGVVGQSVVAARERARLAALADVPGVVDPFDGPVRAVSTSTDDRLLWPYARTADGWLVAPYVSDEGMASVQAVDPADGEVRWRTDLLTLPDPEHNPAECHPLGSDGQRLACHVTDGYLDDDGDWLDGTARRLVVLDLDDGSVLADLGDDLPAGWSWTRFTVMGDLVVTTGADAAGRHVRATSAAGEVVWETPLPGTERDQWITLTATAEVLAVQTADGVHVLDRTGAVRQTIADEESVVRATLGAAVVVEQLVGDGVVLVEGADSHALTGRWVPLVADDGSADGLVLTSDRTGLRAWSRDGRPRWTAETMRGAATAVVLDGRVTVAVAGDVVTLDAATGREVWRADGLQPEAGIATDGRLVLGLARGKGTTSDTVVAFDLHDGSTAWRATLPHEVDALLPQHGTLTALSMGNVTGGFTVSVLR